MNNSVILAVVCLFSMNAHAGAAKILATDWNDKSVSIALDAKGTPRENGNPKTYPSIKDFREDAQYLDACTVGAAKDVKKLLEALVEAANGDGDSWAELVSIRTGAKGKQTVTALITDEGGEREEEFSFVPCGK